jgi:signal transduction histidine kinase
VQRSRIIIERQVLHLSRLVDDLLDVSRITLGTIQLRQETLDLGAVSVTAADSVRATLEAAGLTLEQRIGEPAVMVRGDPTRLAQCIVNLLNNAVKFTARAGRIVLVVRHEGQMAVVEVSDTGAGIAPANLERIFELFI